MQAIRVGLLPALVLAALAMATGCAGVGNPSPSSPSVKTGTLGNGGFTFKCDDSVACDRYHNADTFPSSIAEGSTFDLQFFLRADSHGYDYLKNAEAGTTIEPVGKYVNQGASGFAAVEAGIATVTARDNKGWIVDYITVNIVKPAGLVVYDASYTGDDPPRIASIQLDPGESRSFRTVAKGADQQVLAGLVTVEWTSDDKNVVDVESYSKGKVTIVAKASGVAHLVAKGAALEQTIDVTVTGASGSDGGTGTGDAQVGGDQ